MFFSVLLLHRLHYIQKTRATEYLACEVRLNNEQGLLSHCPVLSLQQLAWQQLRISPISHVSNLECEWVEEEGDDDERLRTVMLLPALL